MVLVALALYFIPIFHPFKFFFPFLVFIFSAYFLPQDYLNGLLLSAAFFLTLGIKNLEFLNRRAADQFLVLILSFIHYLFVFQLLENWDSAWSFAILVVPAALFFFLAKGAAEFICGTDGKLGKRENLAILGVAALLLWQISITVLFLPLNLAHQIAVVFLSAAILFQSAIDSFCGTLNRYKLIFRLVLFCVLVFAIMLGVDWRI